jgi:hypothetical protein
MSGKAGQMMKWLTGRKKKVIKINKDSEKDNK